MNDPCLDPVPGERVPCDRVPGERDSCRPVLGLRETPSEERALQPPAIVPRGISLGDFVPGLAAPMLREFASRDLHNQWL